MDISKKIPHKQLKLLIVLATLLTVVCSYYFGFQKYNKKAELLEKENRTLTVQRNELIDKNSKMAIMTEEINIMKGSYEALLDKFPSDLTQDKNIMFIYNLAKHAEMEIKVISLGENELFYSPLGYSNTTLDASTESNDTTQATNREDILGYKTMVTISYSSTYEGLKKCISYINDYKDRVNVSSITAAFDQTSGILSGTMTINLYALSGTDKEFEEVVIDTVPIGTDNIFGTFEGPMDLEAIQEEPEQ